MQPESYEAVAAAARSAAEAFDAFRRSVADALVALRRPLEAIGVAALTRGQQRRYWKRVERDARLARDVARREEAT